MIKYTIYNSVVEKRYSSTTDSVEELVTQFEALPDVSGCSFLLEKEDCKIKFQIAYDEYFRITFYKGEENRSILEKEEYSKKVIKVFLEDDKEEYAKLYKNPLAYFKQKESEQQEIITQSVEIKESLVYKTVNGKDYTQEEWEEYEREQWEKYKKK